MPDCEEEESDDAEETDRESEFVPERGLHIGADVLEARFLSPASEEVDVILWGGVSGATMGRKGR